MKTLTIKIMRNSSFALALISVLFLNACTQTTSKKETTTSQVKVKKPKMDIHTAAVMGNVSMINDHIAYGSDLNIKEPMGGSTAMTTAALFGHTEIVEALITGGADVNALNNEGSTALHTAAFFCYQDIVKVLLENEVDQTVRNVHGSTALESVQAPFDSVKGIYEYLNGELKPLGITIDYDRVEKTRPIIAEILSK